MAAGTGSTSKSKSGSGSGSGWARALGWGWRHTSGLFEALGSFLYPEICNRCEAERATAADGYVCRSCREAPGHIRWIRDPRCERCGLPYAGSMEGEFTCSNCAGVPLGFDRARAAVAATPFVLDLVHRYKYEGALWYEVYLAELLVRAAAPTLVTGRVDFVVPVPLHPVREREREFNQSARLARRLAGATGLICREDLIRRRSCTRSQALLDRSERAKNVADAFVLRRPERLDGCRVVVVDDILTTGATTSAVGWVLRKAGAAEVMVWTVARGL